MSAGLHLTVVVVYRDGAEVLQHDSSPLHDRAAVRKAFDTIEAASDGHADLIIERRSNLIVRPGERRFDRNRERAVAQAWPERVAGTRF